VAARKDRHEALTGGKCRLGMRPIVQMRAGVAPEVLEGALVGVEELAERSPGRRARGSSGRNTPGSG
jgi:hypothetical protein